jgi:hypothetical protein
MSSFCANILAAKKFKPKMFIQKKLHLKLSYKKAAQKMFGEFSPACLFT